MILIFNELMNIMQMKIFKQYINNLKHYDRLSRLKECQKICQTESLKICQMNVRTSG